MLGQALADARLGRFEVMLVWALDRVSREGVEATLAILRRFAGHGTAVWSLKEPWTETADPRMAELLASLYAWMAAEESRRRSERTRAGLGRREREGLPVGRQPGATDKKPQRRSGYRPDGSETGRSRLRQAFLALARRFCNRVVKKTGIALQSPAPGRHGTSAGGHGPPLASLRPGPVITAPHHQDSARGA
jgi:DNA invertase Pin-like site-specific DNA recombinase